MTARSGRIIANQLLQTSNVVNGFAHNVSLAAEKNEAIAGAFDSAPKALTRDRTMLQVAMDDAMDLFAYVAAVLKVNIPDFDEDSVRSEIYHQMMQKRDGAGVKAARAEMQLEAHIEEKIKRIQSGKPAEVMPEFLQVVLTTEETGVLNVLTKNWQALSQAFLNTYATPEVLLATQLFNKVNNEIVRALNEALKDRAKQAADAEAALVSMDMDAELRALLVNFGEDVTATAAQQDRPAIVGRDQETDRALAAIIKQDNPYALIHGPSGAGITSVTEALAMRIAEGSVPESLQDARIIKIKLGDLQADHGSGQKEDVITGQAMHYDVYVDRLNTILKKTAEHNSYGGPQIILNLAELGKLADPGGLANWTKNLLRNAMESGNGLRIIGDISDEDRYKLEILAPEVAGRFQKVPVKPLDPETVKTVLKAEISRRTTAGSPEVTDDMLKFVIQKSTRYLATIAQPKSALEVVDAALAYAQVKGDKVLNESHVAEILSARTGVPREFIDSSLSQDIASLREKLPERVKGQGDPRREVGDPLREGPLLEIIDALEDANDGINDQSKPLGAFVMPGNTGVGKTYTAEMLAEILHMPLIVIDMGNYQDKHAKSKLIGAPPGYVGYDDKPEFQKIAEQPFSVVLLDEFEKASEEVQNILLSAFDKGRLQLLNSGREIDLRNCVFVMSSNLGTREANAAKTKKEIGIGKKSDPDRLSREAMEQKVNDVLSPEFRGRVKILYFKDLTPAVIREIALEQVEKVSAFLQNKNQNLSLSLSDNALKELIELGHNSGLGARPMKDAIQKYVRRPANNWFKENTESITTPTELHVLSLKDKFEVEVRRTAGNDNVSPAPEPRRSAEGPAGPSL